MSRSISMTTRPPSSSLRTGHTLATGHILPAGADRGFAAAPRGETAEARIAPVLLINVVAFCSIAATLLAGLVSATV